MIADRRIRWAIDEIAARPRDVRLAALARAVNLSRSRFAHLFREQTGTTPGRFLRERRLDHARILLETTFLSIKEVMAAAGFNDPSHFSRDFHAAYGASPREFRRRQERTRLSLEPAPAPSDDSARQHSRTACAAALAYRRRTFTKGVRTP